MTLLMSGVGAEFRPHEVTVTPRMVLAFSACLNCQDERFADDARPAGLEAPPPFCVSLEWRLAGDKGVQSKLGITREEARMGVHTAQSTEFYRPLFAGERVIVSGCVKSMRNARAGVRVVNEFRISGAETDDPISVSQSEVLYRGASCDGPDSHAQETAQVEDALEPTHTFVLPRSFPIIYSECASIWNPIHSERRAARAAGFDDIIVHGTALWALAWKHFHLTRGDVRHLSARFTAPAHPEDLLAILEPRSSASAAGIAFRIDNAIGKAVVSSGYVEFGAG